MVTPSPTSTELLIGRVIDGLPMTPMSDPLTGLNAGEGWPTTPTDFPSMMAAYSQMLSRGLALNAAQKTSSIHTDLQQLGMKIEVMEKKADQSVARINQNISEQRLELDRDHKALQPPRSDGLPRDIIVKPYFDEEVMRKSRAVDNLTAQGHTVQVFADLLPYTVQKLRLLKPLHQILQQKEISYRWSTFPIAIKALGSRLSWRVNVFCYIWD